MRPWGFVKIAVPVHGLDDLGESSEFLPERCNDRVDDVSAAVVLEAPHVVEQFDPGYCLPLSTMRAECLNFRS
jgi:hypothetical protein